MESQRQVKGSSVPTKFTHRPHISISKDGRTIQVSAVDRAKTPLRSNVVQNRSHPLNKDRRFYSMTVDQMDSIQYVMFGLGRYCWPQCPDWDIPHSIRYHSNDGGLFNGKNYRTFVNYTKGDKITCHVSYLGRNHCLVDFLKNGGYVYRMWVYLPESELYPTIGFAATTATLTVDWPDTKAAAISLEVERLSNWMCASTIERDDGNSVAKVTKPFTDTKALSLVAPRPMDRGFNYFEMEILELSAVTDGALAIGLAPPIFTRVDFPGWLQSSIGYHNDDGGLHLDGKQVAQDDVNKCKQGDVMGCGVVFRDVITTKELEAEVVTVYFTKNRSLVYQRTVRQPCGGFFPCVAFMRHGNSVKINTAAKSSFSTQEMEETIRTLNVSRDVICSDNLTVKAMTSWKCSVEAADSGEGGGFVQLTSWPLEEELQGFGVAPIIVPQKSESSCNILVGVAEKVTSSKDDLTWLCSYSMMSGEINMTSGKKLTIKYEPKDGTIYCLVDYTSETDGILMFCTNSRIIGRGMFKRPTAQSPVCATVAITGAGATVNCDWTKILFIASYRDPTNTRLQDWLTGEEELVKKVADTVHSQGDRGTSMQSCSHFAMSTPYVELSVTDNTGQLPAIGLSTAWSDLRGLIGGRPSEISYDPVTGELISNNEIEELEPAASGKVTSVGVGVLFIQQDVREPQDVVVYFTVNNLPVHQQVFATAAGGVYPAITFPATAGCQVALKHDIYPQLAETMRTAWLENMKTNKETQEEASAGTFSDLTKKTFTGTGKTSAAVPLPVPDKGEEEKVKVVVEKGKIVTRGKITFTSDGEATVTDIDETGKKTTSTIGALDKPEMEIPNETRLSTVPDVTKNDDKVPKDGQVPSSPTVTNERESEEKKSESTKSENLSVSKTEPGDPSGENQKKEDSSIPQTNSDSKTSTTATTPTETKTAESNTTNTSPKIPKQLVITANENFSDLIMGHQSMHGGSNLHDLTRQAKDEDSKNTSEDPKSTSLKISEQHVLTASEDYPEILEMPHQSMHDGSNVRNIITQAKDEDSKNTSMDPKSTSPKISEQHVLTASKDYPEILEMHQSMHDGSNLHDLTRQAKDEDAKNITPMDPKSLESTSDGTPGSPPSVSGGRADQNSPDLQDNVEIGPVTNLIMDPSVIYHEKKLRNAQHIKSLSENEAKDVLQAINKDRPEQMSTYLNRLFAKPASKMGTAAVNSRNTTDGTTTARVSTPSSSSSTTRNSTSLRRQNTKSKACVLS